MHPARSLCAPAKRTCVIEVNNVLASWCFSAALLPFRFHWTFEICCCFYSRVLRSARGSEEVPAVSCGNNLLILHLAAGCNSSFFKPS